MLATLLLALAPQFGAQDPVEVTARLVPEAAAPGAAVELHVQFELEPGWHVYHPDIDPMNGIAVSVQVPAGFAPDGRVRTGKPAEVHELDIGTYLWLAHGDALILPLKMGAGAEGAAEGSAEVGYQACDDSSCLPPESVKVAFAYTRLAAEAGGAAGAGAQGGAGQIRAALQAPVEPDIDEVGKGRVRAELVRVEGPTGREVELRAWLTLPIGWHAYDPGQDPELGSPVVLGVPDGFEQVGPLRGTSPAIVKEESWGTYHYLAEDGGLVLPLRLAEGRSGSFETRGWVTYMACDDLVCDPEAKIAFDLVYEGGAEVEAADPAAAGDAEGAGDAGAGTAVADADADEVEPPPADDGLLAFLLLAVAGGLFALVMPCTYPMIPITISFFTKQAEARGGKVLPLSLAYGAGIVAIFILIGVVIGPVVLAFATHPVTNLVIGALFLFFALVLFGFVTMNPPQFLMKAATQASTTGGYFGVFLMGATLVVTSFTCTAPFVGSLLSFGATGGDLVRVALGMGVFGLTMAVPFVFLSLIPGRIQAMPRSGEWMNTVKVTLGFVEVAAAMKFLSNTDIVWSWGVLPRERFLLIWAVVLLAAALYLLGILPWKGGRPDGVKAKRAFTGLCFALFAAYCMHGWTGARMDDVMTAIVPNYSFQEEGGGRRIAQHEIIKDDFEAAKASALDQGKLLFVNFTGHT